MALPNRGLLPTKLHPRQTRPRTVARPRLLEQLERCAQLPLTVVSGPAGAGKSTAVVAWIEHTKQAVAWLSLDASDDSPGRFFAYVLAALQTVDADLGGDAGALLAGPEPRPEDLEGLIADEIVIPLVGRDQALVLVLDDFHLLTDPGILAAVAWLLDHAPPCLRLMLLSRAEPELPLARVRASGSLGELGVDQLRFSPEESRRFYAEVMGLELDDGLLAALDQRTEGWPAGAQLAALSLRGPGPAPELPRGDDRLIADYLLSEVFDNLAAPIRELLLATAALERVCAPLASALTNEARSAEPEDISDARAHLDEVERANLFLIPLDAHRRWFRYHHLFRDFLRERAAARGPAWAAERHRRAALWLAARDLRQEAFDHAVASGDEALITELFERWAAETLMRNQTGEVRRWLAKIPAGLRERGAMFCFVDGWCDIIVGQLRAGSSKLDRASALFDPEHASAHVKLLIFGFGALLRVAALLRHGRYDDALQLSIATRGHLDPDADPHQALSFGSFMMHEALVHLERGELEQAQVLLADAERLTRGSEGFDVITLAHYAGCHRRRGQLDEAERCARRALRSAERSDTAELAGGGLARVELAWVALERGESQLALREVEAGLDRLRLLRDVAYLAHGTELLARAKAALGQRDDAVAVVDEALELLEGTDMEPAIERMNALRRDLSARAADGASERPPAPSAGSGDAELLATMDELTGREAEVLSLVATGLSNREIAKRLCVSVGTVKTHMHRILRKLGVANRTQAVYRARAAGLLNRS